LVIVDDAARHTAAVVVCLVAATGVKATEAGHVLLQGHAIFTKSIARSNTLQLQKTRVDFLAGCCHNFDTPFRAERSQGCRSDKGVLCGEKDGHGEAGVVAEEMFGGVVSQEVLSEKRQRSVVVSRPRVDR
jgi:hypothetical protein